jgi:hypothetical protein
MPANRLTLSQHRALALMSAGATLAAAARSVGVHRNTIGKWLRSAAFHDALEQARQQQILVWRQQSAPLASQAVAAVQAILSDPQTPPQVRLRAALAIGLPKPSETPIPATPPPPRPPAPPARPAPATLPIRAAVRIGRNDPCPCGSGRKYKRCCIPS